MADTPDPIQESPELPEWVKNPYVKGALQQVTEETAKAVASKSDIDPNTVRKAFPYVPATIVLGAGMLLGEQLSTLGKAILKPFRGLSEQLEKIPVIGLVFTASTAVIDAVGTVSGYVVAGIASFLTYKAFETNPTAPDEKHKDVPVFSSGRGRVRERDAKGDEESKAKERAKEKENKAKDRAKEEEKEKSKGKEKEDKGSERESKSGEKKSGKGEDVKKGSAERTVETEDAAAKETARTADAKTGGKKGAASAKPADTTVVTPTEPTVRASVKPLESEAVRIVTPSTATDAAVIAASGTIIVSADTPLPENAPVSADTPVNSTPAGNLKAKNVIANEKGSFFSDETGNWYKLHEGKNATPDKIVDAADVHSPVTEGSLKTELNQAFENAAKQNAAAATKPLAEPTAKTAGRGISAKEFLKQSGVAERWNSISTTTKNIANYKIPGTTRLTQVGEFGLNNAMNLLFLGGGMESFRHAETPLEKAESIAMTGTGAFGLVTQAAPVIGGTLDVGGKAARFFYNPVQYLTAPAAAKGSTSFPLARMGGNVAKVGGGVVGVAGGGLVMWNAGKRAWENYIPENAEKDTVRGAHAGIDFVGGGLMTYAGAGTLASMGGLELAGATVVGGVATFVALPVMTAAYAYSYHYEKMVSESKDLAKGQQKWLTTVRPGVKQSLMENNLANMFATQAHIEMPTPESFKNISSALYLANSIVLNTEDEKDRERLKKRFYTEMDPKKLALLPPEERGVPSPEKIQDTLAWLEGKLTKRIHDNITGKDGLNINPDKYESSNGQIENYSDRKLYERVTNPYELEKIKAQWPKPFNTSLSDNDVNQVLVDIQNDYNRLEMLQAAKAELGWKGVPHQSKNDIVTKEDGSTYFVPKQPFTYIKYETPDGKNVPEGHALVKTFFGQNNAHEGTGLWDSPVAFFKSVMDLPALMDPIDRQKYQFTLTNKYNHVEVTQIDDPAYDAKTDEWAQKVTYRDTRSGEKLVVTTTVKYEPRMHLANGAAEPAPEIPTYETYHNEYKKTTAAVAADRKKNPRPRNDLLANEAIKLSEKFYKATDGNAPKPPGDPLFDNYADKMLSYAKAMHGPLPSGKEERENVIAEREDDMTLAYGMYKQLQQAHPSIDKQREFFGESKKFFDDSTNQKKMEAIFAGTPFWEQYKHSCEVYKNVCEQSKLVGDEKLAETMRNTAELQMYRSIPVLHQKARAEIASKPLSAFEGVCGPQSLYYVGKPVTELKDKDGKPLPPMAAPIDPMQAFEVYDLMTRDSVKNAPPEKRKEAIAAELKAMGLNDTEAKHYIQNLTGDASDRSIENGFMPPALAHASDFFSASGRIIARNTKTKKLPDSNDERALLLGNMAFIGEVKEKLAKEYFEANGAKPIEIVSIAPDAENPDEKTMVTYMRDGHEAKRIIKYTLKDGPDQLLDALLESFAPSAAARSKNSEPTEANTKPATPPDQATSEATTVTAEKAAITPAYRTGLVPQGMPLPEGTQLAGPPLVPGFLAPGALPPQGFISSGEINAHSFFAAIPATSGHITGFMPMNMLPPPTNFTQAGPIMQRITLPPSESEPVGFIPVNNQSAAASASQGEDQAAITPKNTDGNILASLAKSMMEVLGGNGVSVQTTPTVASNNKAAKPGINTQQSA